MSCLIRYSPTGTIILRQGLERLAYLQGDGTAYIDTGTKLNYSSVNNIRVICTNDFEDNKSAAFIGTNSYKTGFMALYHYTDNRIYDRYITGINSYGYKIAIGDKINFQLCIDYKNLKCSSYLNNYKRENVAITKGTDNTNIKFFKVGTYDANKCKCYEVSISIDGGDLKYFIPVRVKSDVTIAGTSYSAGTLGMYDYNNDKLYTNAANSGEFIAGPEVPLGFPTSEYCLVEWLEFKPKVLYNTGFSIAENSTVITEIGIRYKEGENTRDLWGYTSHTGAGYLGVNTSSIWERGTASLLDITKYTTLTYIHKAGSYTGIYSLGGINNSDTFSTRTKYISLLKLTINNVLSASYVACYRRSDMMPGFYDLVSRTFKEIPNVSLGPSITFGWGEVMNGVGGTYNLFKSFKNPSGRITLVGTNGFDCIFNKEDHYAILNMHPCIDGHLYTFSCDVSGLPSDGYINFNLWNSEANYPWRLVNGHNFKTFLISSSKIPNYGKYTYTLLNSMLFDDGSRSTTNGATISIRNMRIVYGPAENGLPAIPHNISSGEGRFGINTAFNFSGTNAYLNTDGLTTGKTYMGWFYTASKPEREVFFADDASGIAFGIYNNGTQAIISTANASNKVFTLSTWNTGWNHIAVVKSDNGPQLYINGIAQTATSNTNGWIHSGGLWIGAISTFDSNFSGRCQDFKVFDTALTLAQIQQEM